MSLWTKAGTLINSIDFALPHFVIAYLIYRGTTQVQEFQQALGHVTFWWAFLALVILVAVLGTTKPEKRREAG